jgi:DNA-binding IclR family transcriptional regulator
MAPPLSAAHEARVLDPLASKRELERLLASARRERMAISHEETIEGATGIAAPVLDKAGDILAGLVIGVPTSRTLSRMEKLQHRVGAAAVEISRLMGYADA